MAEQDPKTHDLKELLGGMLKEVIFEALKQVRDPADSPLEGGSLETAVPPESLPPEADVQDAAALPPMDIVSPSVPEATAPPADVIPPASPVAEPVEAPDATFETGVPDQALAEVEAPQAPSPEFVRLKEFDPGFGPMVIPEDMPEPQLPANAFGEDERERLQGERADAEDYAEQFEKPAQDYYDHHNRLLEHMTGVMERLADLSGNHCQRIMYVEAKLMTRGM